jgi:hypothetical protein
MNEQERRQRISQLDAEMLGGQVFLSAWCAFIVNETDTAFVHGAFLAAILTAVAGIETCFRFEYRAGERQGLNDLINDATVDEDLRQDLHTLRKYRNQWVHINDPWNDDKLIQSPEELRNELERTALFAVTTLRRVMYDHQWIQR